jgi:hypothetical protein
VLSATARIAMSHTSPSSALTVVLSVCGHAIVGLCNETLNPARG